jgi:hypothetical protein
MARMKDRRYPPPFPMNDRRTINKRNQQQGSKRDMAKGGICLELCVLMTAIPVIPQKFSSSRGPVSWNMREGQ